MEVRKSLEAAMVSLIGVEIDKPKGSLAGHSAALPIEELVHAQLEEFFPNRALRHYEFLNAILATVSSEDIDSKYDAFGPPSLQYLLCRGKEQMKNWRTDALFDMKQNDTAETIIFEKIPLRLPKDQLVLVDVKSHNVSKKGQPPNIMSAGKLAESLALALEEGQINFDIEYLGLGWKPIEEKLIVTEAKVVSLFKMSPDPYINWVAAEQIQFYVHEAKQDFTGTKEEWAREYLQHFANSLESRLKKQTARLSRFRGLF